MALTKDPGTGILYAAGGAVDGSNVHHAIIREKLPTSSTWTTLYDYKFVGGGYESTFNAITFNAADGKLYVAGVGGDSKGTHWLVLSATPGQPLQLVDNYQGGGGPASWGFGLASDSAGDVYAVGETQTSTSTGLSTDWTVREQPAGASGFSTVDSYPQTSGQFSAARGVTVVPSGPSAGVYVVGQADAKVAGARNWITRKSTDGGATWSTVDSLNATTASNAMAVIADGSGNLFVAGNESEYNVGSTTQTSGHWVVRESSDGGTNWATVDDWQPAAGSTAGARALGLDALGNVDVVGAATYTVVTGSGRNQTKTFVGHAIARSNNGPGGTWQVIDNFAPASSGAGSGSAGYNAFIADNAGASYAGGVEGSYWLMRDPPAPVFSTTPIHGRSHHHHRHHGK